MKKIFVLVLHFQCLKGNEGSRARRDKAKGKTFALVLMNMTITEFKKDDITDSLKDRQDFHRQRGRKYYYQYNLEIRDYFKTFYPDLEQRILYAINKKHHDYINALWRKMRKLALKKFNAIVWEDNIFYPVSYLEVYLEELEYVKNETDNLSRKNYLDRALNEFEMRKGWLPM